MTVADDNTPTGPDAWPWAPTKTARQQYDDLAEHPAAPVPQDAADDLIRRIIAEPYGAGSTEAEDGPEWDRIAAWGDLVIPYQVHDPARNPQATRRAILILRIVWAD